MIEFVSLEATLEGHFHKLQSDLPAAALKHPGMCAPLVGQLDRRAYSLLHWAALAPDARRQVAQQWDMLNDPAKFLEGHRLWDLYAKCDELRKKITELELAPATIPSEIIAKERRIAELRQEIIQAKAEAAGVADSAELPSSQLATGTTIRRAAKSADMTAFVAWAEGHRSATGTYPSRHEAYQEFAKPRGLSRDWSRSAIAALPAVHRQGVGAPKGKRNGRKN